jgi:hypothetical protein
MVEQYDLDGVEKGLSSKVVRKFPMCFCISQYNSNIMKASRVWKNMENILEAMKKDEELYSIQMRKFGICCMVLTIAAVGR